MNTNLCDIMRATGLTELDIYDIDTDFAGVCLCLPEGTDYDMMDAYNCCCIWIADHLHVAIEEGEEVESQVAGRIAEEGCAYVDALDMMDKYREAFETVLGDYDSYPECGYIDELAGLLAGYYSDKDYETLFNALANESVNRGEYELIEEEEDE